MLVSEVPLGQLEAHFSPLTDPQAEIEEPSTVFPLLAADKNESPNVTRIARDKNSLKCGSLNMDENNEVFLEALLVTLRFTLLALIFFFGINWNKYYILTIRYLI